MNTKYPGGSVIIKGTDSCEFFIVSNGTNYFFHHATMFSCESGAPVADVMPWNSCNLQGLLRDQCGCYVILVCRGSYNIDSPFWAKSCIEGGQRKSAATPIGKEAGSAKISILDACAAAIWLFSSSPPTHSGKRGGWTKVRLLPIGCYFSVKRIYDGVVDNNCSMTDLTANFEYWLWRDLLRTAWYETPCLLHRALLVT